MSATPSPKKRHRICVDVEPGFETEVRLLAAKWGVKTNIAIQRAVRLANAPKSPETQDSLLKIVAARTEELLQRQTPA